MKLTETTKKNLSRLFFLIFGFNHGGMDDSIGYNKPDNIIYASKEGYARRARYGLEISQISEKDGKLFIILVHDRHSVFWRNNVLPKNWEENIPEVAFNLRLAIHDMYTKLAEPFTRPVEE